jgi:predicted RNase H-like nuclease (RuvC/YqgF family)
MIDDFNDGRSRSFFCRAACLNGLTDLESALNEAIQKIKSDNIRPDDTKAKATVLRGILSQCT